MIWKNWSYWLKGGVIGEIIWIIFILLSMARVCYIGRGVCEWSLIAIKSALSNLKLSFFLLIIVGLFIGSIIGFLYGKIKNRKQGVRK